MTSLSSSRLGLILALNLLSSATWAGSVTAASAAELRAACDSADAAIVLQPAAMAAPEARAFALSPALLQWSGQSLGPGERVALLASARGGVQVKVGAAAQGVEQRVELLPSAASLAPELAQRFKYLESFGPGLRLALSAADQARLPQLLRGELLLVKEDAAGQVLAVTGLQTPGALDALYADAAEAAGELGAVVKKARQTEFKLWAPTAQQVHLCRYAGPESPAQAVEALAFDPRSGLWQQRLPANLSGSYYRYLVEVWVPGLGRVRNRVTDPYSLSLSADSARSMVVDWADPRLQPPGWQDRRAHRQASARVQQSTDMVIYELHVRDFSIGDATVPPAQRGKYLAFTQAGSQGMRHLRALAQAGLTDVHLLPVFDLASVPEQGCLTPQVPEAAADSPAQQAAVMKVAGQDCFNWGYDPWHYSAPEGSYASDAQRGERRIREFRQMVQALHRAGLRVGMDVVYNHTAASGQGRHSVLDRIVPGYYQRLDAKGQVERSTCCDNTATEQRMMAKLMIDSVAMWAREYRIDSFRFDLMAHQPRAVMEALQQRVNAAAGQPVQLIGEGWNFGEVANGARFVQASQLSLNGSGIGTFSDRARDAARGGSAGDNGLEVLKNQGWLNGLGFAPKRHAGTPAAATQLMASADLLRVGLAGSLRDFELDTWRGPRLRADQIAYGDQPAGYVSEPGEVVNYVDNHDNQTLFDINVLKLPQDTPRAERARVQLLGAALTAFSQGVAYFHAGIDVLRSKSLDRNSYDSGDWFNRLDWSYQRNFFGTGLPPAADNQAMYPWLAPLLADPGIAPGPAEIAWMRDGFRDLLKIRASSRLLRLSSAVEIRQRLRFLNTGPAQNPMVLAAEIDGQGLKDAGFARLAYFLNTSPEAQVLNLPELAGRRYVLHPVHLAPGAADPRPKREFAFEAASGQIKVPGRTALVLVER
ncbi:alpha-1,6-glucosidase domain-containing protein [Paucibacter sp. B51]|uniref:alpha-1,6-glucosidase domain-containing protein n=1 Tax=Paucibacter sp. B51 TaxID=2993315 RepID=UPI0022EBBAFA|nr:alpha-1,6-glucosidase domain-containing protein [Paucibacter sp. B51]